MPRFECEPHIVEAALDHIFAYLSNVLPRVNLADLPPVRPCRSQAKQASGRPTNRADGAPPIVRVTRLQAVQAHIQVLLGVIPSDKVGAHRLRCGGLEAALTGRVRPVLRTLRCS